ncbi:MAG TPA: hypothetical protein PK177_11825 [Burkholderiaceae bacterium]|nr:hypothetical protein [Burkholderiaceae bacterium]
MINPALRLWGAPLVLGLLTASGLLSALVSDTWGDMWSWFALGIPVVVMVVFALRRPALARRDRDSSNDSRNSRCET